MTKTMSDLLDEFRVTLPLIVATLDEQTCQTCRLNDGNHGTGPPLCEHVANGTGICRCVLVPPKAVR